MLNSLLLVVALLCLHRTVTASYPWPDNVTQIKGYVEVNTTFGVNLFYWFFESRGDPSKDPLVVWLTGGPGCSSELALLAENGPFTMVNSDTPVYNMYGWNSFANLMYIDNPGGTGFSFVKNKEGYATNERTIASELWDLIRKFYGKYNKYADLDLYIVGESYAGHYVPSLGQVIVESNSKYAKNLKGIAIGNGWVDPFVQYGAYVPFALSNKLISVAQAEAASKFYAPCKNELEEGDWNRAYETCEKIPNTTLQYAEKNAGHSINPYDITKNCTEPPLCYTFVENITKFLNRADVQEDLGVNRTWEACNSTIRAKLYDDSVQSFRNATGIVLTHNRRVVVYSGKLDFACNYMGGLEWANGTKWSGQAQFNKEPFHDWKVDSKTAGEVKSAAGMTFLQVEAAGHLVPLDQPNIAREILRHLVQDLPF